MKPKDANCFVPTDTFRPMFVRVAEATVVEVEEAQLRPFLTEVGKDFLDAQGLQGQCPRATPRHARITQKTQQSLQVMCKRSGFAFRRWCHPSRHQT